MAFILGTDGNDSLPGTSSADEIVGLAGNDTLEGDGGNDFLDGGAGNDNIDPGAGNDTIIGGLGDDSIFGTGGGANDINVLDFTGTGIRTSLGSRGAVAKDLNSSGVFTRVGVDTIDSMGDGIQRFVGDATQNNIIDGLVSFPTGTGAPQSQPAGGNASFEIDLSIDNLILRPVNTSGFGETSFKIENFNVIRGTVNDDIISGNSESQTIFGTLGNDLLNGGTGGANILDYSQIIVSQTGTIADIDLNLGDFDTVTIANPEFDATTNPGVPETLTFDSALAFKVDRGNSNAVSGDGITGFDTIIGGQGVNTIDGSLNDPTNTSFDVDLSQDLLRVTRAGVTRSLTVVDFTDVIGTILDDNIVGSDDDNLIIGSLGNDSVSGGAGNDILSFSRTSEDITLNPGGTITFETGLTTNTTTFDTSFERIIGGTSSNDVVNGAVSGENNAALNVNFETGTLGINFVESTFAPPISFEISDFENFIGTTNNDSFVGNLEDNSIRGTFGDDTINGGGGNDIIDYSSLNSAITLLSQGNVAKGVIDAEGNGSLGNDQLLGTSSAPFVNTIESIKGAGGTDIINTIDGSLGAGGNASFDVDLSGATQTLTVNVSTPDVGPLQFDLENFTNVVGTANDDTIKGSSADNTIFGSAGNDIIDGDAGNDILDYSDLGAGIVLLTQGQIAKGYSGTDTIVGSLGTDQIQGIEKIVGDASQINSINGVASGSFFPVGNNSTFDIDLRAGTFTLGLTSTSFDFEIENFNNVVGTTSSDTVRGSDFADVLDGEDGDDFVFGRKGNDSVDGGLGNDTLRGDSGNDTVSGGAGNDKIDGGGNADILSGGDNNDFISGKNGSDLIDGGAGDDTLLGNAANDTIIGSAGNDRINGGGRFDTVDYTDLGENITLKSQGVIEKGMSGSGYGTTVMGQDTLVGLGSGTVADPFVNSIEEIIGAVGNGIVNTIDGTPSDPSDPRASFDVNLSQDSLVINFTEGDSDFESFTATPSLSPNLATQTYVVKNFDNVIGTGNTDTIVGNANDNSIKGSAGSDTIDGLGGNDTIDYSDLTIDIDGMTFDANIRLLAEGIIEKEDGDLGTDSIDNIEKIIVGDGSVSIIDGENNAGVAFNVDLSLNDLEVVVEGGPVITRTVVNFIDVFGTAGNDSIIGDDDDNILEGGDGSDTIDGGGDGNDTITGGNGNDTIVSGTGDDVLEGGDGSDTIVGGTGNDIITGGIGNDTIVGGTGDDIINGVGSDFGANDFDVLTGGDGTSSLSADTFVLGTTGTVFYEGAGFAEILDFQTGTDGIQLAGTFSDYSFVSNTDGGVDIFFTGGALGDQIAATNSAVFTTDLTFVG